MAEEVEEKERNPVCEDEKDCSSYSKKKIPFSANEIELISEGQLLQCHKDILLYNDGYGFIHHGMWKGKQVAIRRVDKSQCSADWGKNFDRYHNGTLDTENVLQVLGFEDESNWRYLALEMFGGTLQQACDGQYRGPMPSDAQVLYQIAKGVDYLHKRGLAHGCLNPQAILMSQSLPVKMKVSDFGLCQFKGDNAFDMDTLNEKPMGPSGVQSELNHLKYWVNSRLTRKRKRKSTANSNETFIVPAATVHGDTFAVGCLFFYFLSKGLHPFGSRESILNNISRKRPVNLKKLDENNFAFHSIEKLIQDPPTDGTQVLRIAVLKFKNLLPLKIDESKELGRGAYGTVIQGTYEGYPVAVKKISVDFSVSDDERKQIKREMEGHRQMNHENVLKLLHIDEEKNPIYKYLVLELCAATLTNYCEKNYEGLELPSDELVLYQIANGLHYIHSRDLVHRDVKPDNILISLTAPAKIKLSDFGLCKKVSQQQTFSQSRFAGTFNWMAPEMLEIINDPEHVTQKLPHGKVESDTFSAGCTHPFGKFPKIPANILEGKPVELESFMQKASCENLSVYTIIEDMIRKKDDRITLSEVIAKLTLLLTEFRQWKKIERKLETHMEVTVCRFHPSEPVLACGLKHSVIFFTALNGSIPFSNWKKSELELENESGTTDPITELQWNFDGNQLAAGFDNGSVIVWSYPSGDIISQRNHHMESIRRIEWNPLRLDVLATIDEGEFKINSRRKTQGSCVLFLRSSKENQIWTIDSERYIKCLKWISENQIALGFEYGGIEIWEMDCSLSPVKCTKTSEILRPSRVSIEDLHWDDNTNYLVSLLSSGKLMTWSLNNHKRVHTTNGIKCGSFDLARCPNRNLPGNVKPESKKPSGSLIAYGTQDGDVIIWNTLKIEQKQQVLTGQHSSEVRSVLFSPDGEFLASVDQGGKVVVWLTDTWEPAFATAFFGIVKKFSWYTNSSTDASQCKLAINFFSRVGTIKMIENIVDTA